jgi:endoglycosylceramidase
LKRSLLTLAALGAAALATLAASVPAHAAPTTPLGHSGRWVTDATGRVVLLHGVNMVYKRPPYHPAAAGFDGPDADFLVANGFNTVRLGIIYAGVEPTPGTYDEAYIDQIAATESLLASRGIFSQLDFHQDLYNERFQGEGWPDWAVQDDGLPNMPQFGFPNNYFAMPALNRAFDHWWANDAGPGGVGLQDRFAAAYRRVAQRFANRDHTMGYDLLNEPWPGTPWMTCASNVGCPAFDQGTLGPFHEKVRNQIRAVEPQKLVWHEPNVLFNFGVDSHHPAGDDRSGFSFHVYCISGAISLPGLEGSCAQLEELAFDNADKQAAETGDALLLSEFGATNDLGVIQRNIEQAEAHMISWQYWHYCDCDDPTTAGPGVQGVVLEADQPPSGSNLREAKLNILSRPYPQLVAGTPISYDFDPAANTFMLDYWNTGPAGVAYLPAAGNGPIPASTPASEVFVPKRHFPSGYEVDVQGGGIASAPNADTLRLVTCRGVQRVKVTVRRPGTAPVDGPDCAVAGATAGKLRMKLRPRRATVGKRRCFRATVRTQNESLVRDARVRIGKRSKLTNERGRARICRTFGRRGTFKATAKKIGYTKAKKKIRVKRARGARRR